MNRVQTTAMIALGAAFAASSAFAQQGSSGQAPARTQSPGMQAPPAVSSEEAQRSAREREDTGFLENAAQGSYAEIEASKLAMEKSESAEVKEFAQKMIDDHQMMVDKITALAKAKGATPPD